MRRPATCSSRASGAPREHNRTGGFAPREPQRGRGANMEVLSSRVLLRPKDFERSLRFYAESLGLQVYREWESGPVGRGVVFFLGGGFLELSDSSRTATSESVGLWLQVRDVDAVGHELQEAGVDIIELSTDKPWGLREMQIRDPNGMSIVIVEVPETHPLRRR